MQPPHRLNLGIFKLRDYRLLASGALSYYISHLARFGVTYGSIGAVVGMMLWFYVSAYAALMGAELNARMEAGQAS